MKSLFICLVLSLAIVGTFRSLNALERTMTYAMPADIECVDPHQSQGTYGMKGVAPFYDTLVYYEGGTSNLIPWIATSWDISSDQKTIDFHLRKGVKFHNGMEMTAEDVYYTFDRMLKTKVKGPSAQLEKRVEKIEVVGPYTFRMIMKKKSPVILAQLTSPWYGIMSKKYIEDHKKPDDPWALKWMLTHECGTGPYQLVTWQANERLVMNRFKDYWGTPPQTDKWTILIIKDPTTMEMMLKKGDVDLTFGFSSDQYENLKKTTGIKVAKYPSFTVCYLNINCQKKPFDDVRVRKAMNYAIKHDEIIKYIEHGNASQLRTIMPEGMWGRPNDYVEYNYNPEKAKQLLKEAGYPNGFSTTLTFSLEKYGNFETLATYLMAYLNEVGIKVALQKLSWPTQIAEMKAKNFDLALNHWTGYYPDPAEYSPYFYDADYYKMGSWNFNFWENAETTRMCKEAEEIMDKEKRAEIYAKIEKIGVENAVNLYLYQMNNMMAMRENVKGDIYHPTLAEKQFATEYKD